MRTLKVMLLLVVSLAMVVLALPILGAHPPRTTWSDALPPGNEAFLTWLQATLRVPVLPSNTQLVAGDVDGDGSQELVVLVTPQEATGERSARHRPRLLVIERNHPPLLWRHAYSISAQVALPADFRPSVVTTRDVTGDGARDILLSTTAAMAPDTANRLYRFLADKRELAAIPFQGGNVTGRDGAVRGELAFDPGAGVPEARIRHGGVPAVVSRFQWDGAAFVFDASSRPAPTPDEQAVIERVQASNDSFPVEIRLFGAPYVLAVSEHGEAEIYTLFSYKRDAKRVELRRLGRAVDDPSKLVARHVPEPANATRYDWWAPSHGYLRVP